MIKISSLSDMGLTKERRETACTWSNLEPNSNGGYTLWEDTSPFGQISINRIRDSKGKVINEDNEVEITNKALAIIRINGINISISKIGGLINISDSIAVRKENNRTYLHMADVLGNCIMTVESLRGDVFEEVARFKLEKVSGPEADRIRTQEYKARNKISQSI